ncbi:hypothetical protein HCJ70_03585 [Listeria booriae]|uniref:hypothetical protein n=1 Tax=Listeria booriae TaxID=1552123 RepID=UPI00162A68D0|nr:hypothetical protein [Listeria booriae]MBC2098119.1 hypothetical protein [Listeria booriae]
MKYFQLKEAQLTGLRNGLHMRDPRQKFDEIYVSATGRVNYDERKLNPDFVSIPPIVVSDTIKRLFKDYQADIEARAVYFNDIEQQKQFVYWWLELPTTRECLHEKTTYGARGEITELVIQAERAKMYHIFQIKHQNQYYWVINLAVAESLLRRGLSGFILEEVRSLMYNE